MGSQKARKLPLARTDNARVQVRRQTGPQPSVDKQPHETLQLQQQAGNRATSGVIRRFPSTALANPPVPVNWVEETASVKKSSEGASGGVFFLKSKSTTEPKMIVVKPNYGVNANNSVEEAGQLVFGDRAISSLFGINTPTSRIVKRGTPEFQQLVEVCKGADVAPTKPEEREFWHPVTDANAMIVMGAVPNATSLSGLADQAGEDADANIRLSDAVFQKSFLHDLGKLAIADLLIGNDDRINAAKMNVGNMMLSSMGGQHTLYAIDSRAVLGQFRPDDVVASGSVSNSGLNGGSGSTSKTLDKSPEFYVNDFFEALTRRVRTGAKGGGENTLNPGDLLWDTFQARKQECVDAFSVGWAEGLTTVNKLVTTKQGRGRMKEVVGSIQGEPGSDEVRYSALKVNATYLAGRGTGKTHEQASPSAERFAAIRWLKEFDPDSMRIYRDEFYWDVARPPSSDSLTGDVTDLVLPDVWDMTVPGRGDYYVDEKKMSKLSVQINDIKAGLDTMGPKTRGVLSKREQPRNRVVLGKWLANCYLLGAGTRRAFDRARQMDDAARYLEIALAGPLSVSDAQSLMTVAMMIRQYHKTLARHLESYIEAINQVAPALPKAKRYAKRGEMSQPLAKMRRNAEWALKNFAQSPRMQNPQVYEHALSGILKGG